MIIEQKLLDIKSHAKDIETKMNSGDVAGDELAKLSKEYSQLNEILPLIDKYLQTQHCRLCKICVIESHHHNPVFGKCVGKNTILLFYATGIALIIHLATNVCLLTYYFGILFFRKIFCSIKIFVVLLQPKLRAEKFSTSYQQLKQK